MSTNKKFRIQNGVDIHGGGLSIDDVTVIGADGKVVQSAIADAVAGLTSSDIADLQAQVSAILGTSPETLDTLQEIVAAFESADSSLTASVAANSAAHTQNSSDIAATNARTSGISTSSGSSNIQMAAEVDMDGNAITNVGSISAGGQGFVFGGNQHGNWVSLYDSLSVYDGLFTYGNTTGIYTELTYLGYRGRTNAEGEYTDRISMYGQFYSHGDIDMGASGSNKKVKNLLDPTAAQDAATKAYVDTASNGASSDLAIETAARIAGDSANETDATTKANAAQAAAEATASADATAKSNAAVATASADATSKANAAQAAAEATASADATAKADAAEVSAKAHADSGDATVQAAVDVVSGRVDAILNGASESLDTIVEVVAAFENADSDIQALISGNSSGLTNEIARATAAEAGLQSQITAEVSARTSGDSDLTASLAAETNAREAADLLMADDISGEATNRQAADAALQSDIDDEIADRIAAVSAEATQRNAADASLQTQINSLSSGTSSDVSDLQGQIDAEESARIAADSVLQGNIDAEASTRASADATLTSDLADEVARATAAEGVIAADLATEVTARTNGDASLQSQINSIVSNTDPAALDSLTEIVAAFQAADGSITGVVNSNTSRITSLEGGVSAIEAWSTDNVSEGSTNLYFTDARAKACLTGGLCITYNSSTGEIKVDETEAESSLRVAESVASDDADKLDGQEGTYYRINVYNVAGSLVN